MNQPASGEMNNTPLPLVGSTVLNWAFVPLGNGD
jgi:hypothetical protein